MSVCEYPSRVIACEHHYCRCMRANELAEMGLLVASIAVHWELVPCRQKGPHAVLDARSCISQPGGNDGNV
jgi:hypothetical protein